MLSRALQIPSRPSQKSSLKESWHLGTNSAIPKNNNKHNNKIVSLFRFPSMPNWQRHPLQSLHSPQSWAPQTFPKLEPQRSDEMSFVWPPERQRKTQLQRSSDWLQIDLQTCLSAGLTGAISGTKPRPRLSSQGSWSAQADPILKAPKIQASQKSAPEPWRLLPCSLADPRYALGRGTSKGERPLAEHNQAKLLSTVCPQDHPNQWSDLMKKIFGIPPEKWR